MTIPIGELSAIAKPMNELIAQTIVGQARHLGISGDRLSQFVDDAIHESTSLWIERATLNGVDEHTIFTIADINEAQLWELVTSGIEEVAR